MLGHRRRAERELAADAGLELGVKGAIRVDRRQATSADGRVGGRRLLREHATSSPGEPVHVALGTVANKQGRVAGINIGGGYATFPGVLGTAITKICGTEVARTGLGERGGPSGRASTVVRRRSRPRRRPATSPTPRR